MPTRKDVALLAGVSSATVSRVLTNTGYVSEEVRRKVLQAVSDLNYHPSYSGQILRGQSTRQVLFFCPHLFNPFYVHVYYGIDDCAHQSGYAVALSRTFDRDMIQQKRYDGVILSVTDYHAYLDQIRFLQAIDMPAISSNFRHSQEATFPNVRIDFDLAAQQVVEHLYGLGHRHIAYASDNTNQNDKWTSVQAHAQRLGIQADELITTPPPHLYDNLYELGRQYAERYQRQPKLPTAIIGANDAVATGLIGRLSELGFRIPAEVSIIGFDDTYLSPYTVPPLTTVHFPKYQIGYELMAGLKRLIEHGTPQSQSLPTRLILRSSTAPARDDGARNDSSQT